MSPDREFFIGASELHSDDEYNEYKSEDLPYYVDNKGSFHKLPWATTEDEIRQVKAEVAIVGAPFDEGTSARSGARMAPLHIRRAPYHWGNDYAWSIQLDLEPLKLIKTVDAGDAPVVPSRPDRAMRVIHEKVFRVATAGAIPIVLGGDHSITYPSAAAIARYQDPRKVGIVHFDAHADAGNEIWGSLLSHGTPMRRLIEQGWIEGKNFVQVGLRGYWPGKEVFDWMQEQGMRWHTMVEIEERGMEAVISDAINQALDGPDCIYLSVDIDVVDPGTAPGTGTPEPGGILPREMLRAVRQIVQKVNLVGMDIVEVSPAYDQSEVTTMLAHRIVLEAISALAKKKVDSWGPRTSELKEN